MANKLKPWSNRPYDEALGDQTNAMLDWMVGSLNQLIGQNAPPPSPGISSLSPGILDPTTAALKSAGSRTSSLTTGFGFTATTTSISLFWDGSNSSTILRVYRDDGTIAGPFPGNQVISGLSPSTTYFFYPYFDEATQLVKFVSQAGAVGSPPIAYITQDIAVGQSQILRGRVPLANNLAVTGIATPGAGSTPATAAGGGGASSGSFLGRNLK